MKRKNNPLLIFTVIFCGIFFSFSRTDAQQNLNFENLREAEMKSAAGKFGNNLSNAVKKDYNMTYACCRWNVDPSVNYISGNVSFNFSPGINNFDTLTLDLADPMIVDSVIYNNSAIPFYRSHNSLDIIFSSPLTAGVTDSVKIFYHGIPVPTGNGSFTQIDHSGTPVIFTLSEPYGARDWWPCKQDLNDKIDSIDIYVTSPLQYKTASNGLLISDDSTSSQRTCHWKSNYPIAAYLVAIGVTNYTVFSEQLILNNGDTLPVINYVYPENLQLAQQVLHQILDIIQLYDSLTIPYPFSKEKYGHAQFGWGGGMEHQTMTFLGNYSSELVAHECAHQWFGDKVTCGSWHDIWLHEGFAVYFSGLTVEYLHPSAWMAWKSSALETAVSQPGGSVYCDDTTSVARIFDGRLTYMKASCLLHMIRWKIGDAAFFTALKNYLNDPALAYGYARTDDLKNHFEQASGQDLTDFFNEWFYGSGFPSYRIEWEEKSGETDIAVFQTTSDPSVSFFHVPVPIELKGEYNDTIVVADPMFQGEIFSFNVGFKIDQVIFDPDLWIISKDNVVVEKSSLLDDQVVIYPNPGNNIFTVFSKKPELIARSLTIFDHLGKEVLNIKYNDSMSRRKINLSALSAGNYFLQVETGSGMLMEKLLLQK